MLIIKAIKKIINISNSEIMSDGERYIERSRVKGVSIGGKAFLKIKNAFYVTVVKSLINRALELKLKLELLRFQIKMRERLTWRYNLKVIVSI